MNGLVLKMDCHENSVVIVLINGFPNICEVHDATFTLTKGCISFYWPTKQWIKDQSYAEITHWMPLTKLPGVKDET